MSAPPAWPDAARNRPAARRVLLFVVAVLVGVLGVGAHPGVATVADPEGGTAEMRRQLDEATRAYLDAKAKVDASKAREQQLALSLDEVRQRLAIDSAAVAEVARLAYETSGFTTFTQVISVRSPDGFLDGMTLLSAVATREANLVRKLRATQDEATTGKAAVDAEIATQQEQLAIMEQRKQDAQRAMWAVGGGQETSGFSAAASAVAEASPRNGDGSWPAESCSVYEDATGGCVTPRTAHAKGQAQTAGFTGFVTCYRSFEDGGEHPRGRACDFAIGTGGSAAGDDRVYGNNLAAYFLFNADRLGVLYIIWYRQIWLPGSGWRAFTGCCDPSSMHTNHVHVSVY